MTDQKLIRLIEDNGLNLHGDIEHFAHLVAAAEREACAKVCESLAGQQWVTREAALECSDAIRARVDT